ncbi:MAG: large-conductance mechanosensitive channel protein MscL [Planctomycetes bacterium]|nr:large-conductance mechanosensitive channel protein MscL [Planctomycetota bacterium]
MGLIQEFKDFAMRGNVIDLAVGVVIGGAFGKIVDSLVKNLVMPIVGFLTKGIDVAKLNYTPPVPEGIKIEPPTLAYGAFLQSVIDFLIIAAAIFFVVKAINAAKARFEKTKDEAPAATPEDILLLREIRDSLKAGK